MRDPSREPSTHVAQRRPLRIRAPRHTDPGRSRADRFLIASFVAGVVLGLLTRSVWEHSGSRIPWSLSWLDLLTGVGVPMALGATCVCYLHTSAVAKTVRCAVVAALAYVVGILVAWYLHLRDLDAPSGGDEGYAVSYAVFASLGVVGAFVTSSVGSLIRRWLSR